MREVMDDYSCPPGSVVIFTESLVHAANDWTNPSNHDALSLIVTTPSGHSGIG